MSISPKVNLDPIEAPNRPAHVPAELVRDLGWAFGEQPLTDVEPYKETAVFFTDKVPPLMWSPDIVAGQPGVGAWVVTQYEDITFVYQESDIFSTKGAAAFQQMVGETWPCIPLGVDAPEHMKYRAMLNPHFSPKAVDILEKKILEGATSLLDPLLNQGKADFAYDFARVYPVRVFMDLMGFPLSDLDKFVEWHAAIILDRLTDMDASLKSLRETLAYLRASIAEHKANPGKDDLTAKIVTTEIAGRPITDDEVMGTMFFLWLGGIDTVAASLSLMFRRLAIDTAMQQKLRDNPDMIPEAIEEFLRTQPLVNSQRLVKRDFQLHGQTIKAGDWISCMVTAGNFDPEQFDNPREVRLDREPNRHFTFSGGPHRCLGSHLARREMRIALGEWLRRVPPFRLADDDDRIVYPGLNPVKHLNIVW